MGYTHYWTVKDIDRADGRLKKCIEDMKIICENSDVSIADGLGRKGTNPIIDTESLYVRLNGEEPNDYETFNFPGDKGFNFCKTNYRPYDKVVVACLLVVARYFYDNEIEVNSDGDHDDWKDGWDLYVSLFQGKDDLIPPLLQQVPWNHPDEDDE